MSSRVIVLARERIAQSARVASGPARRGQGGQQCVQPGGTVIARGLTRRRGLRAPPSISIHLATPPLTPDQAGGRAWASAPNNENNCLPAWHYPYLLWACCPLLSLTSLAPSLGDGVGMGSQLEIRCALSAEHS